jgi:hypothetical protein
MLSVLDRHPLRKAAFVIGVCLMMGCGFDAVLKSPGPADVRFVFSDTLLTNGSSVPLVVGVIASGTTQQHPNLIAFTYNPNVVGVSAGDDSLIARHIGIDSINIRFQSTLRAAAADTVIRVRVKV